MIHLLLKPIIKIFLNGAALYLTIRLIPEIQATGNLNLYVISGIILGLINTVIKPIVKILALPVMMITGGLFSIIINMVILWFLSSFLDIIEFRDASIHFPDLAIYLKSAIVLGVINWGLNLLE